MTIKLNSSMFQFLCLMAELYSGYQLSRIVKIWANVPTGDEMLNCRFEKELQLLDPTFCTKINFFLYENQLSIYIYIYMGTQRMK